MPFPGLIGGASFHCGQPKNGCHAADCSGEPLRHSNRQLKIKPITIQNLSVSRKL
jgi:hypothetical protein